MTIYLKNCRERKRERNIPKCYHSIVSIEYGKIMISLSLYRFTNIENCLKH